MISDHLAGRAGNGLEQALHKDGGQIILGVEMSGLRDMNRKMPLLSFRETDPIRLVCEIDFDWLFETEKARARFDEPYE